jgi:uncharacterized protein YndB with AHSA1/START domain
MPAKTIRWRMHIPVSPEKVFAALDSAAGRARFWAESADETNGCIDFHFINGVKHRSRVIERPPPATWSIEYFGSAATFTLTDDGDGGTDLLLSHAAVEDEEWPAVHAGWLNVLFPLKAWVTYGIDLRNHDSRRTWDHGYADQ